MWLIMQVWSPQNMIPNHQEWLDSVLSMMKTRKNNDVINRIGQLFVENKTEVSQLIRYGTVCDEV